MVAVAPRWPQVGQIVAAWWDDPTLEAGQGAIGGEEEPDLCLKLTTGVIIKATSTTLTLAHEVFLGDWQRWWVCTTLSKRVIRHWRALPEPQNALVWEPPEGD